MRHRWNQGWIFQKTAVSIPNKFCFLLPKWKQYVTLSNYKQILIFPSEFSVLPNKISKYLQANSLSDANTRDISDFYNILGINILHFKANFTFYNKHRFSTWLCPYQRLKSPKTHPNMGVIIVWNGHNQNIRWIITDYNQG